MEGKYPNYPPWLYFFRVSMKYGMGERLPKVILEEEYSTLEKLLFYFLFLIYHYLLADNTSILPHDWAGFSACKMTPPKCLLNDRDFTILDRSVQPAFYAGPVGFRAKIFRILLMKSQGYLSTYIEKFRINKNDLKLILYLVELWN